MGIVNFAWDLDIESESGICFLSVEKGVPFGSFAIRNIMFLW